MLTALHQPRAAYHLLRLSVAGMMLFHGISKVLHGIGGIEARVVSHGLPAWLAYGVYVGEVLAPLLLIANVWVQGAAIVMAVNMLFAIFLAHAGDVPPCGAAPGRSSCRRCSWSARSPSR